MHGKDHPFTIVSYLVCFTLFIDQQSYIWAISFHFHTLVSVNISKN